MIFGVVHISLASNEEEKSGIIAVLFLSELDRMVADERKHSALATLRLVDVGARKRQLDCLVGKAHPIMWRVVDLRTSPTTVPTMPPVDAGCKWKVASCFQIVVFDGLEITVCGFLLGVKTGIRH